MHGVALATPTKALVSGHLSHRPLRHRGTARLVRDKPRNVGLFRRFKPPSAVGTGEQESQTETHDEESKETISSNVSNVVAKPRDFFADNYGHVMLQGFHWTSCNYDLKHGRSWYGELRDHVSDIQATGATVMWLPPPSHSVSPEGYLPQCLYDLNTRYGTAQELRDLCRDLKQAGIAPMADIVINHRCADTQDENGNWRIFSNHTFPETPEEDGLNFDKTWGPWAIVNNDPNFQGEGNADTGDTFAAAPDLDHANPRVREELTAWLIWLKNHVGFVGWRFDFAKGYGAQYAKEYAANSVGLQAMNVAEYWPEAGWEEDGSLKVNQDPMRQAICNWLDKADGSMAVFDFVTKAVLQEAVAKKEYWRLADKNNKPPGLIGWWPERSVTFLDNHDTGGSGFKASSADGRMKDGSEGSYGQGHWRFPPEHRMVGYAYILSHPGIPCLFWPHAVHMHEGRQSCGFNGALSEEISILSHVRRAAGVQADSHVDIKLAENELYVAHVKGLKAELIVKLGPRYRMPQELRPAEDEGWEIAASGKDYAIWWRANE